MRQLAWAFAVVTGVFVGACTQDFEQFRGSGGAGTAGGGGVSDACIGVDCDDNNPCTQDSCSAGVCAHIPGVATFPDPDDCLDQICEEGVLKTVNDNTETPDDMNVCTVDMCSAGMAVYTFAAPNTVCNGTGFCDGAGNCSLCNSPEQCGTDMPCGTRTCDNNTCGWAYELAGTVVGGTGDGDCMVQECNGTSELPDTVNGNDPTDDSNTCTTDTCNGATTVHTNVMTGTACDDGAAPAGGQCSAAGACVDCTSAAGCPGGDVCLGTNLCCTPLSMAVACGTKNCGMVANGCGGMVSCGTCTAPTAICSVAQMCVECGGNGDCTNDITGHECITNSCQCNGPEDCTSTKLFPATGNACIGASCGCAGPADCAANPAGVVCTTGACGCVADTDCVTSVRGGDCRPDGRCGCANNGDCGAPASGTCQSGVCQ